MKSHHLDFVPVLAPGTERMKIAIIGAGAVGGTFGAALHRSGQQVRFLARSRQLVALRERGLRITGVRGSSRLRQVSATDQPGEIGPADVVLLAVKLWDVERAAAALAPMVGPNTVVIPLQNGVDAPERVAAAVGERRVAAGACFVNAGLAEPGVIVQSSAAQKIVAGMLAGHRDPILDRFAAACSTAGIEFEHADAPLAMVWEKFVQMVPIGATTSLLRRSIGAVREDPDCWHLFLQLLHETVFVGRAAGAPIPAEAVARRLAYVRAMPFDATSSMTRDLLAGRRLELPWLSGRVAELGRRHGVPTPANDFVLIALKPFVLGGTAPRGALPAPLEPAASGGSRAEVYI